MNGASSLHASSPARLQENTQNLLRMRELAISDHSDVLVLETAVGCAIFWLAGDKYLRKKLSGSTVHEQRSSLSTSSKLYANMQIDNNDSCQKTDLLKSCDTFRVLVAVTGSVAALKLPLLVSQLLELPGVSCFLIIYFYALTAFYHSFFCLSLSRMQQVHLHALLPPYPAKRAWSHFSRKVEI